MSWVSLFTILLENPQMPNITFAVALIAVGASVVLYQIIRRKASRKTKD